MNTTSVLVVDDSEATANIVTSLLKLCGFVDVDQALSGEAAIGMLQIRNYGLILADMFLPSMNGVDLLHWLRNQESPIGPPAFFLMTALRDRDVIQSAIRYKADGIILKPFTVAQLKQKFSAFPNLLAA